MTMIGSPACPLGRLEGQARGGGEGEGRCRLSSPPPKGATPCDRPPRGAILIPRPLGVVDYSKSPRGWAMGSVCVDPMCRRHREISSFSLIKHAVPVSDHAWLRTRLRSSWPIL